MNISEKDEVFVSESGDMMLLVAKSNKSNPIVFADAGITGSIARSRDMNMNLIVWERGPGAFTWKYEVDEAIVILSGVAYLSESPSESRRVTAGDIVFFPAGSSCEWQITETIRKVAVLREPIWRPLGYLVKLANKAKRSFRA